MRLTRNLKNDANLKCRYDTSSPWYVFKLAKSHKPSQKAVPSFFLHQRLKKRSLLDLIQLETKYGTSRRYCIYYEADFLEYGSATCNLQQSATICDIWRCRVVTRLVIEY